jgi:NDP-sugar pyrophosphorylase family protein
MVWDPAHFEEFVRATDCDACLVSYRGFHAHYLSPVPYAYSRMDGERVVEVKEKGWFGPNRELEYASCGAYYFRTATLLAEALEAQEKLGLVLNGESYTSLTVQALLQSKKDAHVRVFEIPYFFQWGTPEDLEVFEYWHRSLTKMSRYQGLSEKVSNTAQVLMPMCGLGSRFSSITPTPKPFIPIDRQPMFQSALQTLPPANRYSIVALQQHEKYLSVAQEQGLQQDLHIKYLPETPPGQALSVQAGLSCLHPEGDIIISSCDHGIVLNPEIWREFSTSTQADAAIFTIQGFPGGARKPNAFAWVEIESKDSIYPRVKNVSVKKPISNTPMQDHLLVGTFWFRNKKILELGLERLIAKDTRVNGEVYLDSIFNELIGQGYQVNVIPLDGYICWGDPDSLAESLYWQEVYFGRSYSLRPRFPGVS